MTTNGKAGTMKGCNCGASGDMSHDPGCFLQDPFQEDDEKAEILRASTSQEDYALRLEKAGYVEAAADVWHAIEAT